MFDKVRKFINKMNEKGIPIPMIRVDGKASLSATLTVISFNTWLVSVIGKAAGALGGMDSSACLQMFLATAGLYWGRKFQKDEKGSVTLDPEQKGS